MIVLNVSLFLISFVSMEFVAWFTHKYIMHGFLWSLHRDHHRRDHSGFFERNDFFFLIFAIPGISLMYVGFQDGIADPRLWIGLGISLYGMAYVFVHDIFIHQRVKVLTRTQNVYLRALRKAHKIHHKHVDKEDGECFGMLSVPRKFLSQAKQSKSRA